MSRRLLSVRNLKTSFFTHVGEVKAVRGISFDVNQGEVLGIVGESGSGKSVTSLSIMGLLQHPGRVVDGEIFFQDQDILSYGKRRMRRVRGKEIAMIFQDPMTSLNPVYTVGNQIMEMLQEHEDIGKGEAKRRAIEMLRMVGIPSPEKRIHNYPHEFSGGMRQRAMIAIALACSPKLLIADEPTTALDVTIQAQILQLIRDLQKELGMSVIYITHDLGVVANVADRVAVMYAGQIVEYGTVEEIFYDAWHPYTWALLQALPQLGTKGEALPSVDGTPPNLFNEIKGDAFAPRNKHALAIDFVQEPPFFQVSETHAAKTWYLDPRAPKIERPHSIQNLREKMGKMGGANLNG